MSMRSTEPLVVIPCKEGEIKVWAEHNAYLDPKGLIAHPDNNNIHTDDQVEVLKAVLKVSGWREPVVVSQKSMRIVSGHLRVATAIKMGMDKIPVSLQYFENRIEEVRHLTADNELARMASFDIPKFKDMQQELMEELEPNQYQASFFNPHEWGMGKYPKEKAQGTKKEPVIYIAEGQMWQLGPNELHLGSMTPQVANHIQKFIKKWRKINGAPAVLEATGQTFEEVVKEGSQK